MNCGGLTLLVNGDNGWVLRDQGLKNSMLARSQLELATEFSRKIKLTL